MTAALTYTPTVKDTMLGDKPFKIKSLTPVFTDKEARQDAKNKIENDLYAIFVKYIGRS